MENIIILFILLVVVGGAVLYIYKCKKRGQKCIGCPYSEGGCCKCNMKQQEEKSSFSN